MADTHELPGVERGRPTALEQIAEVYHDDLSCTWMARPDCDIEAHARLVNPANLKWAFMHSYGVGESRVWGLFVPHAIIGKRLFGFWFNKGLDSLIAGLFGKMGMSATEVGRYVSRFILHLDTGIGHCVEWFESGHALISTHHYSSNVGRFEADLVFTLPVNAREVPGTPVASLAVKRDCHMCRVRDIACQCSYSFRRRVFAQASFIGLTWNSFSSELHRLNVLLDKFTIDARDCWTGLTTGVLRTKSESTYTAIGANSSDLILDYLRLLGCVIVDPDVERRVPRDLSQPPREKKQITATSEAPPRFEHTFVEVSGEAAQAHASTDSNELSWIPPTQERDIAPSLGSKKAWQLYHNGDVSSEQSSEKIPSWGLQGLEQVLNTLDPLELAPHQLESLSDPATSEGEHIQDRAAERKKAGRGSKMAGQTRLPRLPPVHRVQAPGEKRLPPSLLARYPCPVCGTSFRQQAHTDLHVAMVHERKKPFSCEQCDWTFGSKSNLNRHVRVVHEGKKPKRKGKPARGGASQADAARVPD